MALIQGVYVQNFPSNLNPMRMSVVVARDNPGLFNKHLKHYETRFYKSVYDELADEYEITWLKKIEAIDVEGNTVSGRVIDEMLDDYNSKKTQCSPPLSADDSSIINLKLYIAALNQDPPLSEDDYNLLLIIMSTN